MADRVLPFWPWRGPASSRSPSDCTFLNGKGATINVDDLSVHLLVGEGDPAREGEIFLDAAAAEAVEVGLVVLLEGVGAAVWAGLLFKLGLHFHH